jgi:predicted metal-dependent enzyme (double-stranded beta helix superfamily)
VTVTRTHRAGEVPSAAPAPPLPRLGGTARRLHRLTHQIAARPDLWRAHVRFAHESRYTLRVAATETYEAWLLTWLPGQSTGLHDHGGSAGAFIVLAGQLQESTLAPRRGPGHSALLRRTLGAGRIRSFGSEHVHDVTNAGSVPAVSLHVYAPVLVTMRRFVLDDRGRAQVVSWARSGVDW